VILDEAIFASFAKRKSNEDCAEDKHEKEDRIKKVSHGTRERLEKDGLHAQADVDTSTSADVEDNVHGVQPGNI
jgi:hypothetical protein